MYYELRQKLNPVSGYLLLDSIEENCQTEFTVSVIILCKEVKHFALFCPVLHFWGPPGRIVVVTEMMTSASWPRNWLQV
jgi:hypothetical protein